MPRSENICYRSDCCGALATNDPKNMPEWNGDRLEANCGECGKAAEMVESTDLTGVYEPDYDEPTPAFASEAETRHGERCYEASRLR